MKRRVARKETDVGSHPMDRCTTRVFIQREPGHEGRPLVPRSADATTKGATRDQGKTVDITQAIKILVHKQKGLTSQY